MKATTLFGRILRSTHDYVGWIQGRENEKLIISGKYKKLLPIFFIRKVHKFNSLPIDKRWFERGEEPQEEDFGHYSGTEWLGDTGFEDASNFQEAYHNWQNWTPLLEGDWEIINQDSGGFYIKGLIEGNEVNYFVERGEITETLNDFITQCNKQGIELVINPEFEIR
jgi:hypothetical protein